MCGIGFAFERWTCADAYLYTTASTMSADNRCAVCFSWRQARALPGTGQRNCTWTFYGGIGSTKQRTAARQSMKRTMDGVPGGCTTQELTHTSQYGGWHLNISQYQDKMCSTVFAACPSGNAPMTFRLMESLECGAIPIIDDGGKVFEQYMPGINDVAIVTDTTWTRTLKGEPLADYLKSLLGDKTALDRRRHATMVWYNGYKASLRSRIAETLNRVVVQKGGAQTQPGFSSKNSSYGYKAHSRLVEQHAAAQEKIQALGLQIEVLKRGSALQAYPLLSSLRALDPIHTAKSRNYRTICACVLCVCNQLHGGRREQRQR